MAIAYDKAIKQCCDPSVCLSVGPMLNKVGVF